MNPGLEYDSCRVLQWILIKGTLYVANFDSFATKFWHRWNWSTGPFNTRVHQSMTLGPHLTIVGKCCFFDWLAWKTLIFFILVWLLSQLVLDFISQKHRLANTKIDGKYAFSTMKIEKKINSSFEVLSPTPPLNHYISSIILGFNLKHKIKISEKSFFFLI